MTQTEKSYRTNLLVGKIENAKSTTKLNTFLSGMLGDTFNAGAFGEVTIYKAINTPIILRKVIRHLCTELFHFEAIEETIKGNK